MSKRRVRENFQTTIVTAARNAANEELKRVKYVRIQLLTADEEVIYESVKRTPPLSLDMQIEISPITFELEDKR